MAERVTTRVRQRPEDRCQADLVGLLSAVLLALLLAAGPLPAAASEVELVMFSEPACPWCERWDEEIGGIYERTEEGQRAPLRRVDMTDARPAELAAIDGITYSPTFVLVQDGQEIGRILGYPGDHFFWPLLQDLLAKLTPTAGPTPEATTVPTD